MWDKTCHELKYKFLLKDHHYNKFFKLHNLQQCDMTTEEYMKNFMQLFITCNIKEPEEQIIMQYLGVQISEFEQVMQLQPY